MNPPDDHRRVWWGLLAVASALHLAIALLTPVSGDEAYYWECSRNFDWSYFDQPPLVIWLMAPFRWMFGETALAVRAPAVLSSLLIGILLLPLARRLGGGEREAGLAYLILHATPLVLLGSSYTSTDVLMTAMYVGAAWSLVAIAQGDGRGWWGFGAFAGLGFLTKFPMVAVLVGLIPILSMRHVRANLRTPTPWLAGVGSLALTAPVWIWGARHHWDNITFQFGRVPDTAWITHRYVFEFVASNLALATPFVGIAMIVAWWQARERRDPGWTAFRWVAIAPVLLFGLLSLRGRVASHWGAPTIVLSALMLSMNPFRGWRWWTAAGAALSAALLGVVLFVSADPEAIIAASRVAERGVLARVPADKIDAMAGYDETVEAVLRLRRPNELVASESYSMAHTLAFVSAGALPVYVANVDGGMHGLASLYWYRNDRFRGRDLLWVTARPRTRAALVGMCDAVEDLSPVRVERDGILVRQIELMRCRAADPPPGTMGRLDDAPVDVHSGSPK